ncbi:hypothetical protein [Bacillus wiedmannii]|uniref:hypothetical protein n=1 Tax=Bacillus wiedmannii TaxID=1890302 RepID=UPI0007DB1A68|nr:hypothetical protein [Bacillus wiedmannii]OAK46927.1 hypothetical protein A6285_15355 [Bacillus wiedmannii]HDR7661459.1 hypothetical protein [Bacillus wiedmannii]
MKFNHLTIEYDGIIKTFNFESNFNLIYSDKNSVGKSTLLRFLFYSLGYNIPSTRKIKFQDSVVICNFENPLGKLQTRRLNNLITIDINNQDRYTFVLPNEETQLHSLIWGTTNEFILNNILGSIYLDQDKGWTLLNRGIVLGSIRFNIEELIQGLAERDVTQLREKQQAVELEYKKYRQLQNIIEYKEHLTVVANDLAFPDFSSRLENQIQLLTFEKNELEVKLKALEKVKKDNTQFVDFIEKMKLSVKDKNTGITTPVTKETLIHFKDNQMYIDTRYNMLKIQLATINKELTKLNHQLSETQNLVTVQSEIEKFDSHIANLNINNERVKRIIDKLAKENKELKREINDQITYNNIVVTNLHKTITKYAEKLGVANVIDPQTNYIFTSDLKSLSGAVLHKIVFSFKMAYILEIQKVLGINLPIVLDSPSGREVDQENIEETMNILMEDFSENQVIIASIYHYKTLKPLHNVKITNYLLEE